LESLFLKEFDVGAWFACIVIAIIIGLGFVAHSCDCKLGILD
jgi:hypothetical protein|tara:strand:- start:667 stop:792 length:126 start_codon:yes stop_codon:yes gene_type:complete